LDREKVIQNHEKIYKSFDDLPPLPYGFLNRDEIIRLSKCYSFGHENFEVEQNNTFFYLSAKDEKSGRERHIYDLSFDIISSQVIDVVETLSAKYPVRLYIFGRGEKFTAGISMEVDPRELGEKTPDEFVKELMLASELSVEYYLGVNQFLQAIPLNLHPDFYSDLRFDHKEKKGFATGLYSITESDDLNELPLYSNITRVTRRKLEVFLSGIRAERVDPKSINSIIGNSEKDNIFYVDINGQKFFGFALEFSPLLLSGNDIATSLGNEFNRFPEGTIIQSFYASMPMVGPRVKAWVAGHKKRNIDAVNNKCEFRTRHIINSSLNHGLIMGKELQSREDFFFITSMIPIPEDLTEEEILEFKESVSSKAISLASTLSTNKLYANILSKDLLHYLIWHIINLPAVKSNENIYNEYFRHAEKDFSEIMAKFTRIYPSKDGMFTSSLDESMRMVPILIEEFPEYHFPQNIASVTNPFDSDQFIRAPFVQFTNIEVMPKKKVNKKLVKKLGLMNKQLFSDTKAIREMMEHLFHRRDDTKLMMESIRRGSSPFKITSGILLFTPADKKNTSEEIVSETISAFETRGYKVRREEFITPIVWKNSLPFGYDPQVNSADDGISASHLGTAVNATSAILTQGSWAGTPADQGGILMSGRRGQTATIDIFSSSTNYNFVTIGGSGGGKSFFNNELVSDIYARGGIVRIIDVGESYKRLCLDVYGGEYLDFDPDNPMSVNPFWGIRIRKDFNKSYEGLVEILNIMANPFNEEVDPYINAVLETALVEAWETYGGELEGWHIHKALLEKSELEGEPRLKDVALLVSKYLAKDGVYGVWFNGKPDFNFTHDFAVLELENLNSQKQLRNVILPLVVSKIGNEMYLDQEAKSRPSIILIDEAWDLLAAPKSGRFIETAFRRARKYYSSIGIITQSFEDLVTSSAAKAAQANSEWLFILKQKESSIKAAIEQGIIEESSPFHTLILEGSKDVKFFSNVFVKSSSGIDLFKFTVDFYSLFLYTTNAKEKKIIQDYKDTYGFDELKAVKAAAAEFYKNSNRLKFYEDLFEEEILKAVA